MTNQHAGGEPDGSGRLVALLLGVWLVLALVVGVAGWYEGAPAPVIGATNGLLVTLTLLALVAVPRLRAWAAAVSLRGLILYHVVRFVGIAFLVLYANGTIPGAFAVTAGWGDILAAVTALGVAFACVPVTSRARWWGVLVWNVYGLLDIIVVLRTGIGMGLADPSQMTWITVFPLSLLPTFIVPLILVTHGLIFWRLWQLRAVPSFRLA